MSLTEVEHPKSRIRLLSGVITGILVSALYDTLKWAASKIARSKKPQPKKPIPTVLTLTATVVRDQKERSPFEPRTRITRIGPPTQRGKPDGFTGG